MNALDATSPATLSVDKRAITKVSLVILPLDITGKKLCLYFHKEGPHQGKYLGVWGSATKGETVLQAAHRILKDEASLESDAIVVVGMNSFIQPVDDEGSVEEWLEYSVVARGVRGTPKSTSALEPSWVDVEAIPYDKMWADDFHWFPPALQGTPFVAVWQFVNSQDNKMEQYDIRHVAQEELQRRTAAAEQLFL
ncbi:unnamed protein product [Vitrella brassicaformis CCMP3155]|uniref:Nudix hydrolase domain-containing protein n=2 Tax=Vitrella brassicaformis TaxID=1169539 RepID=A0A0G4GYT3_VITBC|nr:unnamed protein product [Vitrella brassicaformis CCMP3155]|eukprot:CEM36360.1 unnamed protein product [Vitrella brassicaformis CCMP3155]